MGAAWSGKRKNDAVAQPAAPTLPNEIWCKILLMFKARHDDELRALDYKFEEVNGRLRKLERRSQLPLTPFWKFVLLFLVVLGLGLFVLVTAQLTLEMILHRRHARAFMDLEQWKQAFEDQHAL